MRIRHSEQQRRFLIPVSWCWATAELLCSYCVRCVFHCHWGSIYQPPFIQWHQWGPNSAIDRSSFSASHSSSCQPGPHPSQWKTEIWSLWVRLEEHVCATQLLANRPKEGVLPIDWEMVEYLVKPRSTNTRSIWINFWWSGLEVSPENNRWRSRTRDTTVPKPTHTDWKSCTYWKSTSRRGINNITGIGSCRSFVHAWRTIPWPQDDHQIDSDPSQLRRQYNATDLQAHTTASNAGGNDNGGQEEYKKSWREEEEGCTRDEGCVQSWWHSSTVW